MNMKWQLNIKMVIEKTKILVVALAVLISSAIPFSYFAAAQDNTTDSSLEQLSDEELQELESQLESIISPPSTISNATTENDFQVDLVWKANTYIPSDYNGKALPAVGTSVKVHAIAHTKNPEKLKYIWVIEDTSSYGKEGPNLSGTGKDTFSFITQKIPEFTHELKVVVQDLEANKEATVRIEIQTVLPETNLYILNNGNYNNLAPLTLKFRKTDESGLMARVFYLNSENINNIDFIWKLNGTVRENDGPKPYIIPITIASRTMVGAYLQLQSEIINKKMNQNVYERAKKTVDVKIIE
jgi:hypothetical protein